MMTPNGAFLFLWIKICLTCLKTRVSRNKFISICDLIQSRPCEKFSSDYRSWNYSLYSSCVSYINKKQSKNAWKSKVILKIIELTWKENDNKKNILNENKTERRGRESCPCMIIWQRSYIKELLWTIPQNSQ